MLSQESFFLLKNHAPSSFLAIFRFVPSLLFGVIDQHNLISFKWFSELFHTIIPPTFFSTSIYHYNMNSVY